MKTKKTIRHYSEAFKQEKVKMLEERKVTVRQLSKIYEVSETAIYKWIRKYSTLITKQERVVVEKESEGSKTIELMKKVAELERIIGQKQLEIDFLNKTIEIGSSSLGVDIKKKYVSESSPGLGIAKKK